MNTGIMSGVGEALMNIGSGYQKKWAEEDLIKERAAAEEQKGLRILEASTKAGIMAHRENAQTTADISEAAANKNRVRIAGYGGDVDAAVRGGEPQIADDLKKLNDKSPEAQREAHAKMLEGQSKLLEEQAKAVREGRGKNGTGGNNGLGQSKFDEAMVTKHVKENAAFYTFTNDMDPTGKPQENLIAKQTYVGLLRKHGPDVADQAMTSIMDEAQRVAADPKTGNIDQTKANAAYIAGVSALRGQLAGKQPAKPADTPTQALAAEPAQPKKAPIEPADMGYSPDNEIQFNHVMSNLSNKSMRAQALSWLESGGLSLGKRQQVERALR